jgi:hypothetical protein
MPVRPAEESGAVSRGAFLKASKSCCFRRSLPTTYAPGNAAGCAAGRLDTRANPLERVQPRQRTSNRQLMNRLSPLVSDDTFEVEHVANRDELRADAGAA